MPHLRWVTALAPPDVQAIKSGVLSDRLFDLVARINRHSQITLAFAQCDGTAGW